jgi:predicted Zn-dependent protease
MRVLHPQAQRAVRAGVLAVLLLATHAHPALAAIISQDEEIRIGREAAAQLEAEVGLSADPSLAIRLQGVGRRVAAVSSRRSLAYSFKVIRGRDVNAISLPGGFIYATEGLMRFAQTDAELAFVMGHEIGHVAARHHVAMIEQHMMLGLLSRLLLGGNATTAAAGEILRFLLTRGFSRENEAEADRLGVGFAHRAGFDASAALEFLGRLRAAEGRDPDRFEVLLRTHPATSDRIQRVRAELRAIGYRVPVSP